MRNFLRWDAPLVKVTADGHFRDNAAVFAFYDNDIAIQSTAHQLSRRHFCPSSRG